MAEVLSKTSWTTYVQARTKGLPDKVDLPDKDLQTALAALDKTGDRDPTARIDALEDLAKEVPRQVTALGRLKKTLGDKAFSKLKDRLYEMAEEAEAQRRKAQAALKDADEDDDDDSKPSALLDAKLLYRQLSLCRKDPERTMKFAFVDAKDKQQPAILALHPRMGARSLFGKLQAASDVKTGAYGSAWVDGSTLMLQLDKPLSGLVKKVRGPVKACGFKISKAVLWNPDGSVFEQDDEADGDATARTDDGQAASQPSDEPSAPKNSIAAYEARRAALMPHVAEASARGSADAPKHQALLEFAAGKAQGGDLVGALAALSRLQSMLDQPAPGPVPDSSSDSEQRLATALAHWKTLREAVAAKLQAEIRLIAGSGDPKSGQAELELRAVLKQLSGTLATRREAAEMDRYLSQDEVVADVSQLAFDLKTPLLKLLGEIKPLLPA